MDECGATTTIGVDSWDTPAYRKCILPTHSLREAHEDFSGFKWVDEKVSSDPNWQEGDDSSGD